MRCTKPWTNSEEIQHVQTSMTSDFYSLLGWKHYNVCTAYSRISTFIILQILILIICNDCERNMWSPIISTGFKSSWTVILIQCTWTSCVSMRYTWSWPWQKFALLSQKSTFIAIKYMYIYHYQVCFVNLRAKHLVDILYAYVSNEITHYYQMLLRVKYYMYLTIHIFISTKGLKYKVTERR